MKSKLLTLTLLTVLPTISVALPCLTRVTAQDDRAARVKSAENSERRVALVIGNSAYKDSPLTNPVNDARDMAATLSGLGFEVIHGENLSQNEMKRNIRAFGEKIRNGGAGLFYFAGHGVQVNGRNYLIPIGAAITSEEEVEYESVDAGLVLAQMETARNRLNIVVLDACRNNPFARSFRSSNRGLATIDAPSGTLIAYATAPGSVASDGAGKNGLYTQELLKRMRVPNLNIEQVFKQVRIAVRDLTEGKQIPWESSSLVGDFYFKEAPTAPSLPSSSPSSEANATEIERSFWESIRGSTDPEDFKAYLDKYPSGAFAALARNKLRALEAAAKPTATNTSAPVEPKPNAGRVAAASLLRPYEYETVSVDSSGSVTNRRRGQARYFTQDIKGVSLEMVEIPGGTFMMGSPSSEANRSDGESPQHQVSVQTFYMGKYEVTQAQWRVVASLPKVKRDLNPDPSNFKGDDLPVEQVSWEDAVEFCERLSKATGRQYRLPSESEWEYACRAGTTTPFAFGATITPELVNYNGQYPYAQASKGMYREKTTQVGYMGVANAFGLYDMHGNVWEWCLDAGHDSYNNAPADGSAWERAGDPGKRVLRGGSWLLDGLSSRAAYRFRGRPDGRLDVNIVGFRVVLAARTR